MEIKVIFEKYLEYLKIFRKKGTYNYYKKNFILLEKAFTNLNIREVNAFNENTYVDVLIWIKNNTNKKNSKINDCMSCFLTALNYQNIKYNFKIIKLTDDTTPFKILNDNELKELFKYLDSLDIKKSNNLVWVASIYIALDTGARKNELLNIKTKNVDLVSKTIYLETTKTEKRFVKFGKNSEKYINLLYDINNEYLLFNRLKEKKLTRSSIEHFLDKINKNLILDSGNITLHRLRKTLATKLFISGMPLPSIQKILGHSDIKMTMRYIDVTTLILDKHYEEFYPFWYK